MSKDITLRSIREWHVWYNQLKFQSEYHNVWDNICKTDRKDWLAEPPAPTSIASQHKWELYRDEQKGRREIMKWMADHVSPSLREHILDMHNTSPEFWLDELMARLDINEGALRAHLQARYKEAMSSLAQRPTDHIEWIEAWYSTMKQCRAVGLTDAKISGIWWPQLQSNISHVFKEWPSSFRTPHAKEIVNGSLTFETVIQDLRLECREADNRPRKRKCP